MFGLHNYTGFVAASLISLVDQAGLVLVGNSIAGRLARFSIMTDTKRYGLIVHLPICVASCPMST
jgi:hypothetical protein